jgi:hypothetical protein
VLQVVAGKLEPHDAQRLAAWVGAELQDWRILAHEGRGVTVPALIQPLGARKASGHSLARPKA